MGNFLDKCPEIVQVLQAVKDQLLIYFYVIMNQNVAKSGDFSECYGQVFGYDTFFPKHYKYITIALGRSKPVDGNEVIANIDANLGGNLKVPFSTILKTLVV